MHKNDSSMGLKSGEYGGKYRRRIPLVNVSISDMYNYYQNERTFLQPFDEAQLIYEWRRYP